VERCWIILLAGLVIAVVIQVVQAKAKSKAYEEYQEALSRLRRDPGDPHTREETLRLGREYSNLTQNRRGVTVFDEVALSNDIGAATAGAFKQARADSRAPAPVPESRSVEARLAKLVDLKSKGLIDESEYASRRSEILREI
jgi:hypothetical protein